MHSEVGQFYLGEKLDMHRRLPENVRKLLFCKGNYEREVGGMGWKHLCFIKLHTEIIERGSIPVQFWFTWKAIEVQKLSGK